MIPLEHFQFAAMILTGGLTLILAFMMPRWATGGRVFNLSRWLMTAGTLMLPIQFLLQYTLHFRQMGVTQGVLVNLLFFIPCVWLICLSILNLLRQGKVKRHEWLVGLVAYPIVAIMLLGVNLVMGKPILEDTAALRNTEMAVAVVFSLMQIYYSWLLRCDFKKLRLALNSYYDQETDGVIRWMRNSVMLLTLIGLFTPFVIFLSGAPMMIYSVGMMYIISYSVLSFYSYGIDHRSQQTVRAAEEEAHREEKELSRENGERSISEEEHQRIDRAVQQWLDEGGHLHSGITIHTAAREMGVPRYQLTAWMKGTPQGLFNPWITQHRLEAAKQMLRENPEWSNDSIAERCGFGSRSYFQTLFKKHTGMTPAQFIMKNDNNT